MTDQQGQRLGIAIRDIGELAFRLGALTSKVHQDQTKLRGLENEVKQLKQELANLRRQR